MQFGKMESLATGVFLVLIVGMSSSIAVGQAQVFRCTTNGIATFSDRPCGTDAETYEPDDARVSTFEASPITESKPVAKRTRPLVRAKSESVAAAQAKHAETCARIESSLRDIRTKMRAGYNAKQGERLNERHRKLTEQRREQRCR